MSCFLMINSWVGEDQMHATEKIARVFCLDPEEADVVVDNLANGNPWQFDHQVSDRQSQIAEPYLQSLGFELECIPVMMAWIWVHRQMASARASRVSLPRSKTCSVKNVNPSFNKDCRIRPQSSRYE